MGVGQEPEVSVRLELLMHTLCPGPCLLSAMMVLYRPPEKSEGHMWRGKYMAVLEVLLSAKILLFPLL